MDGCVWPLVVGRVVFGGLLDDELEFGAVLHLNEDAFVGVADACVLEGLADGYLVEDGVLKSVEPGQQIPEAVLDDFFAHGVHLLTRWACPRAGRRGSS